MGFEFRRKLSFAVLPSVVPAMLLFVFETFTNRRYEQNTSAFIICYPLAMLVDLLRESLLKRILSQLIWHTFLSFVLLFLFSLLHLYRSFSYYFYCYCFVLF